LLSFTLFVRASYLPTVSPVVFVHAMVTTLEMVPIIWLFESNGYPQTVVCYSVCRSYRAIGRFSRAFRSSTIEEVSDLSALSRAFIANQIGEGRLVGSSRGG